VFRSPDVEEMRKRIFSVAVSDGETRETIREAHRRYGVLLEPHGAVGWKGLETFLEKEGLSGETAVVLETAHPAKFPDEIIDLLGITPELPESLMDLDGRPGSPVELPADYAVLRDYLLDTLRSR